MRITLLAAVLAFILVGAGCKKQTATPAVNSASGLPSNSNSFVTNQNQGTAGRSVTLSMAELAKHNTSTDCWLLISGSVYDVTSFIQRHPGGAQRIIPNCGRDATTAFQTQGGEGSHSSAAMQQLAGLRLGSLNAVVSLPN